MTPPLHPPPRPRRGFLGWSILILASLFSAWTLLAIFLDLHPVGVKIAGALSFVVLLGAILVWPTRRIKTIAWLALHASVLLWWLRLKPVAYTDWQVDVSRLPWSERTGDHVVLHDVRNFFYRTETDYDPHWENRTVDLTTLQGADLFLTHWGVPLVAHSIVSFRFSDGSYLATSIEARKRQGEAYSTLRGFFRQYEVIYLLADERDVVRLRTNYRQHEEVYLYRTKLSASDARRLFEAYLGWMNAARTQPQWYNAVTLNCGTPMISFLAKNNIGGVTRTDWRGLLAGEGDKMLYDLGDLATNGLAFDQLRSQAHINVAARTADTSPDFSQRIRKDRTGFEANPASRK